MARKGRKGKRGKDSEVRTAIHIRGGGEEIFNVKIVNILLGVGGGCRYFFDGTHA